MKTLEAFASIHCSQEVTQGLNNHLICLSVINTLIATTSVVGNAVILIALRRGNSLHQPSKALLRNLVTTDLCVGVVEFFLVGKWISILQERWQICHYFYLAYILGACISINGSLWTLTAVGVDRILALSLGLSYRQVVTLRRVYVVTVAVWLLGIGNAILAIMHPDAAKVVLVLEITVCLITSFSCHITIFFRLRHQQIQVHNNSPHQEIQTIPLNLSQYRKTVSIAVLLLLTFVFCYLPYLLFVQFARREIENKQSPPFYFLLYSTITLVFVNSSLNPILFCWKIKEVRHAVKDMLRCRRI